MKRWHRREFLGTRLFLCAGDGWYGIRVYRFYLSLRSPKHRPLFSERNRFGCRVLALRGGWRIVLAEVRS